MDNLLNDLIVKDKVTEVINRLFIETDNRDWPKVEECFAAKVLFDMTSMTGGNPQELTPSEITAGWEDGLKNLKALHHQTGNYIIKTDNRAAYVFCYGTAVHYTEEPSAGTRTFTGSYNFKLELTGNEWKISAFKFNLKWTI